jgi:hypothetical protein
VSIIARVAKFVIKLNNVHFIQKITEKLNTRTVYIKIITFFTNTMIVCHTFGCIFYFIAKSYMFGPDTWIYRNNYMNDTIGLNYLRSLYYAITAYITIGYGDITAYAESIIIILILIR